MSATYDWAVLKNATSGGAILEQALIGGCNVILN